MRGSGLRLEVARSGGPGGQHVNTTSSKVTVVLEVSAGLSPSVAAKVRERYGPTVRATASTHRSQHRNRAEAMARLLARIDDALVEPTYRAPTSVPLRERRRRARDKQARSRRLEERRISDDG